MSADVLCASLFSPLYFHNATLQHVNVPCVVYVLLFYASLDLPYLTVGFRRCLPLCFCSIFWRLLPFNLTVPFRRAKLYLSCHISTYFLQSSNYAPLAVPHYTL